MELQQKYATASEELKALLEEKLAADEAYSRLRQSASQLEQRSELASSELEVIGSPPRRIRRRFCCFLVAVAVALLYRKA